jgi:geranylgeranyl diphosphate synthase type I
MTDHSSTFNEFSSAVHLSLQEELKHAVANSRQSHSSGLGEMISYQMGWSGEGAGPEASGKQIRPKMVLLSCAAAGGQWQDALPAAAAVELIHNFSLIHDDIEDHSKYRRGRPTIWKIWGIPQAINTGDAMFALANAALLRLEKSIPPETVLEAGKLFHQTCLRLTQGQHLDILFESIQNVSVEDYWEMVSGKTAALLAFSMEVGALCAKANKKLQKNLSDFGLNLGLAFQAQDDFLGIWGIKENLGKSTSGDLVSKKKTLPVLFGLNQSQQFKRIWDQESLSSSDIEDLKQILEKAGGYDYTKKEVEKLTQRALHSLEMISPSPSLSSLLDLADLLLSRTR